MKFIQSKIDDLNAVLTVTVEKDDYADKVNSALKNYKKNANIPGFRKGQVPMSLIKKQHEKPLMYEEVNKLLQSGVDNYLKENKIEILAQPLPKADEKFDWDAENLDFSFDLGLAPSFDIELDNISVPYHKITVSDEDVDKYVENFATRYGKMSSAEEVKKDAIIKGVFHEVNDGGEILEDGEHYHATIHFNQLNDKDTFEGKKREDRIQINNETLFEEPHQLAAALGIEDEQIANFDKNLSFKINEITHHEKAEVNQELFDKVYGEGAVDSEEAFRTRVKEEAEKMYVDESDRVLLGAVLMDAVENTKFDLPVEFLKKWIRFNEQEPKSEEEIDEMYENSEKGIRYQLIEGKLAKKYDITVEQDDVLNQAVDMIKQQMAMYGVSNPEMDDNQLKQIAISSLQNEEEYKKLADQVFAAKMLDVVKDHVNLKEKEVSFDEFIEEVKKQNEKVNA
ncbi:trigger factor [Flavobacteriaceae bacterium Ap0902]|nr:trigger factor [Flavobacteriaceae bacterium Ap0902]